MKVLFATTEAYPFVKTGGLGDVAGSLPKALNQCGVDARVILPLYESIANQYKDRLEFIMYTYVSVAWRKQYCGLFKLEVEGVTFYFVDNEYYFKRSSIYGCYDDAERFAFFSRAIFELIAILEEFKPDVVHANDWQTALIPIYIREDKSGIYKGIKTVFTVHNMEYHGRYGVELLADVFGLPKVLFDNGLLAYQNDINLMKGAIYTADYITTVSPTYAQELMDPYYGHGLHMVVYENRLRLRGILNGIDNDVYNPATDKNLYKNYSRDKPEDKLQNKLELQRMLGLRVDEGIPIVACISRLVAHKGFDLILSVIDEIMESRLQLVILGTGDWNFEQGLVAAASRYPGRISVNIMYSEALAAEIYAGADILLMPSRSEPCGLSQMIAMRYGTVPIVRETGGLKDSVSPYRSEHSTGFTFAQYNPYDMLYVLKEAMQLYYDDKKGWQALVLRCMNTDFSWEKSAAIYKEVYDYISPQAADAVKTDSVVETEEPIAEEPIVEEPAERKPAERKPAGRKPAARKPATRNPATRNPAARNPAAGNPVAGEPAARNPAAGNPVAGEPAARNPAADEPAARKPAAKKTAAKKPAAQKTAESEADVPGKGKED